MPQSLSRVLLHLVFSTKHRMPLLDLDIQPELHSYLAGTLRNHSCPPVQAGGHLDHVHLLFGMSRTLTVAQLVERLKTGSAKWLKGKEGQFANFQWQAGYGVFSVGQRDCPDLVTYIRRQEEHHRTVSFQEEFLRFLREHNVPYDERYVWD